MAPLDLEAIERELAGPMRPVGLHELAKAVGGLAFVEVSLFRQLGVLALGAFRDGAGEWASGASMQAAWRRAQLESLLPLSVGLPCAGELVVPPGPATTEAMAQLSAHSAVAGSPSVGTEIHLAVLAVVRFVYPALAHSYSARQKWASESADGPFELVFSRLEADVVTAAGRGSRLVSTLEAPGQDT